MKWGDVNAGDQSNTNGVASDTIHATRFVVAAGEAGGVFKWARVAIGSMSFTAPARFVLYADGGGPSYTLLDWTRPDFTVTSADDFKVFTQTFPGAVPCVAGTYLFGMMVGGSSQQLRVQQLAETQGNGVYTPVNMGGGRIDTSEAFGTAPPNPMSGTLDLAPTAYAWEIESTGPEAYRPEGIVSKGFG